MNCRRGGWKEGHSLSWANQLKPSLLLAQDKPQHQGRTAWDHRYIDMHTLHHSVAFVDAHRILCSSHYATTSDNRLGIVQ
jgi:hypothetical protein